MASTFESTFNTRCVPAANRAFGVSVTLNRGANTTASITARRTIEYQVIGVDMGIAVRVTHREYVIAAADIVLNSVTEIPQEGDRITEGSEVFEVLPTETDPAVELLPGAFEYILRTKKVA